MSKPESWDAKDFIFSNKYYCPICATPEDGTCQVLVDWEIEKWGSCKVLKDQGIYSIYSPAAPLLRCGVDGGVMSLCLT